MSNRFSALSDSMKQLNKQRPNIFQKPRHNNYKSHLTRANQPKRTNNQFSRPKTPEFKLEDENFPILSTNMPEIEKSTLSYSEKIKQHEEIEEVEPSLPTGYTELTHKSSAEMTSRSKTIKEPISEYYRPYGAYLIMEDRRKQREELNDILGDISPYWDMPVLSDDEYEDEEHNNYNDEYSEEEYVEDW